jgi:membrane associated rhomboid family serine protease
VKQPIKHFGTATESFLIPAFLLIIMWLFQWANHLFNYPLHTLGVLPKSLDGLKGILFMPLIHSSREIEHIINNSLPTFILTAALFYFYRSIAVKVFVLLWIFTGFLLWAYAANKGVYHIGMSGVIYGLASFLFTSGVIRKFLPLQGISLFVAFIYGSMIWGVFPMEQRVSWEGHLMGFLTGIILAFVFRKEGPQRPKFQYEIEKELGIEPPDLEGMYLERLRQAEELEAERKRQENGHFIVYHYIPTNPTATQPEDDSEQVK